MNVFTVFAVSTYGTLGVLHVHQSTFYQVQNAINHRIFLHKYAGFLIEYKV